jgi:hypothetical protein
MEDMEFDQFIEPLQQVLEGEQSNQKQELPLAAIFVGGMGRNEETL